MWRSIWRCGDLCRDVEIYRPVSRCNHRRFSGRHSKNFNRSPRSSSRFLRSGSGRSAISAKIRSACGMLLTHAWTVQNLKLEVRRLRCALSLCVARHARHLNGDRSPINCSMPQPPPPRTTALPAGPGRVRSLWRSSASSTRRLTKPSTGWNSCATEMLATVTKLGYYFQRLQSCGQSSPHRTPRRVETEVKNRSIAHRSTHRTSSHRTLIARSTHHETITCRI